MSQWKKNDLGEWLGVMADRVWRLKQTEDRILYQVYDMKSLSHVAVSKKPSGIHKDTELKRESAKLEMQDEFSAVKEQCNDVKVEVKMESEDVEKMESMKCDFNSADVKSNVCKQRKEERRVVPVKERHIFSNQTGTAPLEACARKRILSSNHVSDAVNKEAHQNLLRDYFQFNIDLNGLYSHWSSRDPHFQKVGSSFQGIRLLRQEPVECLLSFVCSSNNHISRISSMVEKLCTYYGNYITTVDGKDFYSFPRLSALCGDNVESHLRELGFGYRAKFISSIAKHVTHEKGEDWLESLRGRSYPEAKAELMTLLGVGAKVADCVCLMSLDKPEAIPVDTHVWQITMKNYLAKLHNAKSLTDKLYNEIGDFYRNLWGPYAGWAQAVLFAADLRHNKERDEARPDAANEIKNSEDDCEQVHTNRSKRKQRQAPTRGKKKK